jgi:uncharacterized protein (TIGR02246 family)
MATASAAETDIRATIDAWLSAVRSNDSDKIAAIHAEDGRIIVAGSPVISGRQAIAEFWHGLLAITSDTVTFGPTLIDVDPAGTMAFEVGTYAFSTGATGELVKNAGKYTVVWKKIGGSWKVCVDSLVAD